MSRKVTEAKTAATAARKGKFRPLDLAALCGLVLFVIAVAALLYGASSGYAGYVSESGAARSFCMILEKKTPCWAGSRFAGLAWLANLGLLAAVLSQLRSKARVAGLLPLCSLFGFLGFGVGLAVVSMAWAVERQNYWDAIDFASLLWLSAGGALSALVSARVAAKRGSMIGSRLFGPAVVCAALLVIGWAWTWFPPLQELQADIARSIYLGLHG